LRLIVRKSVGPLNEHIGRPKTELELQHTPTELHYHYQHARTTIERRRAQVIWLLATGTSFQEPGTSTAYSHVSVKQSTTTSFDGTTFGAVRAFDG
jgi:hypothetical protein